MKKSNVTTVIASLLFVIMAFGLIGLGVKVFKNDTTNTVNTMFGYSIGSVDEASGKVIESNKNIVMKDIQKTENMSIEYKDTSTVTYKVFFYDEEKSYISCSNALSSNFDITTIPENAEYFRVVITPAQIDGEDVVISKTQVEKYAKQLVVVFGKS